MSRHPVPLLVLAAAALLSPAGLLLAGMTPAAAPAAPGDVRAVVNGLLQRFPELEGTDGAALRGRVIDRLLGELDPSGESRLDGDALERGAAFPPVDVRLRDGVLVLTRVALLSAAWRTDAQEGDVLLRVDGRDCAGASLPEVDRLLRGEPGTEVELKLLRPSQDRVVAVKLKREAAPTGVFALTFDKRLFYVRPASLEEESVTKVLAAEPDSGSALVGVILDLRGASGGGVEEARRLCGRFMKSGQVAQVQTAEGAPKAVDVVPHAAPLDARLVVLVDAGTGPAGELTAAALKEGRRALVLGGQTTGAAAAYAAATVEGGATVRLPSYRLLTPGGVPLFRKGVQPDLRDQVGKVPLRKWIQFRHQYLALLKGVKPDALPMPGAAPATTAAAPTPSTTGAAPSAPTTGAAPAAPTPTPQAGPQSENGDEGQPPEEDDDEEGSQNPDGAGEADKSLEDHALGEYPLVRQYDRPFVRALNLLVSMDIFYKQMKQ